MGICHRCNAQTDNLHAFRGSRGGVCLKRERLCSRCLSIAEENHGLTPAEIEVENAEWERAWQKNADPYYYTASPYLQSTFGSFASQLQAVMR